MKVIINTRFGGFGLSRKALLALRKKGNQYALNEPDYGEYWDTGKMRQKGIGEHNGSFLSEIPRHDVDLINVVEELGEEANGDSCELTIIEVPDDTDYVILEMPGGPELIADKTRLWG